MTDGVKISGSLLARNTVLSLVGRALPLIIAVVTIPVITRGLGADRFGILALAWVIIGYFRIVDLGLGRATTKFVAEALGKNKHKEIPQIVWSSLAFQLLLGVLGGVIFFVVTPVLVERVLNIPPELTTEARNTLYILSFLLPVLVCSIGLRGVLEAAQRFDLVNAVYVPSLSLNFLLPALGVFLVLTLPVIVGLMLLASIGTLVAYLILSFRLFPAVKQSFTIDIKRLRTMISFGGWVTISSLLIPILIYADRFIVGAFFTIADVGYYSVANDILSRLSILPASFAVTFFPAISALELHKNKTNRLYTRSLKYMLLIMGPMILLLIIFAGDVLGLWLGREWALKTTLVFQILAIGIFLNALAQIPANLLDGIGRPDLRTKTLLFYMPVYIGMLWLLVAQFGIVGAALAWTLRAVLELLLFFGVVWKVMDLKRATFIDNGLSRGVMIYCGVAAAALLIFVIFTKTLLIQSIVSVLCLILFGLMAWRYVLDDADKQILFSTVSVVKK